MTVKQLKDKGWIIYEVIAGSHAYGTNVEGSDTDYRGIFIQPTEDILRGDYIDQVSDEKNDIVYYEVERFLELLMKSNPNIQEMIHVPDVCITYKNEIFDKIFTPEFNKSLITKKMAKTFVGFAHAQIKKSKGLNKKMNWEDSKMVRKTPLDFCYVLGYHEESFKFEKWKTDESQVRLDQIYGTSTVLGPIEQSDIGLAKVNNFVDMYSMYHLPESGGIVAGKSNELKLLSIDKGAPHLGYMRFDGNAYSTHCKDYQSYQTWLKNRNELRYNTNKLHGKNYDSKNMMHCVRILEMALDITQGKGLVVYRPNADYLLSIRRGEIEYNDLIKTAENLIKEVDTSFANTDIPDNVDSNSIKDVLQRIRFSGFLQHTLEKI